MIAAIASLYFFLSVCLPKSSHRREPALVRPPLNINIGVLGHIDSGKTSLAKALSTQASTAAFDKSRQSQERGITLDLGFSSFTHPLPLQLASLSNLYDAVQYTLVDCPGHAGLIRTIIGGAQIMDLMFLVIDVTKGIQTQTAEGLVIGEITTDKMIVILNKCDLLPAETRVAHIDKLKRGLSKTLSATRFVGAPMVCISAAPKDGGPDLKELLNTLTALTTAPRRTASSGPLVFAVDHCFFIKGQGAILTGTILSGTLRVGDTIEIPSLKVQKKVKSMQVFKKAVQEVTQGSRVGVCVAQLEASLLERGLVGTPGHLKLVDAFIMSLHKIRFYKQTASAKVKYHLTVGHETHMATVSFFSVPSAQRAITKSDASKQDPKLPAAAGSPAVSGEEKKDAPAVAATQLLTQEMEKLKLGAKEEEKPYDLADDHVEFDQSKEYVYETEAFLTNEEFALVKLEKSLVAPLHAIAIASHLDTDLTANQCRLVFYGRILRVVDTSPASLKSLLKVYKPKVREGQVERVVDATSVIGKGLVKKEDDVNIYVGMKVEVGPRLLKAVIESSFGKTGKYKLRFINADASEELKGVTVYLRFKRYVYDNAKHLIQ